MYATIYRPFTRKKASFWKIFLSQYGGRLPHAPPFESATAHVCALLEALSKCISTDWLTVCTILCQGTSESCTSQAVSSSSADYQIDLLRAVEMSRLQFLADTSRALAYGLPEGCVLPARFVKSRVVKAKRWRRNTYRKISSISCTRR